MALLMSHFSVISSNTLPELNDYIPVLCLFRLVVISGLVRNNENPQYWFHFCGLRNSICFAHWLVTIKMLL